MTISYSGNFCRLLLRWKGSLWRSVWKELLIYLVIYYAIRLFYLIGIDYLFEDDDDRDKYRSKFEALCRMFDGYTKLIPLTFLLGFYVSNVVSRQFPPNLRCRWWRQFECLAWPEDLLSMLCTVIHANDEISQKRRHTIARYINLASALAWRDISKKIRLRFPNVSNFIDAGLLTEKEFQALESIHVRRLRDNSMDGTTALGSANHAQGRSGSISFYPSSDQSKEANLQENKPTTSLFNNFMTELKLYRQSLRKLFCYDWVCVPLVYTQVAALATYAFFFFALFGRQNLIPEMKAGKEIDLIVPIFTIVQFMFFVGWFKVGQDLMRPFGLDDDDIEMNYILDRNIATSFAIVNRLQTVDLREFFFYISVMKGVRMQEIRSKNV
ncbi:Bestrophin [Ancylostoma duodenale]|uniref:Bestrophin homolog n=1 Tax=Ancylostoma duodenale TaxID=51022 RepID=A0A0C2DQT5_9BILA|nr:Bestrophin [Ancylostoma duodenale]